MEHFYGHPWISEQLACGIMHRLPFPAWLRRDVPVLVRVHDDVIPANGRAVRRGRCFEAIMASKVAPSSENPSCEACTTT